MDPKEYMKLAGGSMPHGNPDNRQVPQSDHSFSGPGSFDTDRGSNNAESRKWNKLAAGILPDNENGIDEFYPAGASQGVPFDTEGTAGHWK